MRKVSCILLVGVNATDAITYICVEICKAFLALRCIEPCKSLDSFAVQTNDAWRA